jgi:hypothetical protein
MEIQRQNKFGRYVDMIIGKSSGSLKQKQVLAMYRFAFTMSCEGYTPLVVAQAVADNFDVTRSRGFKVVQDAKVVFGDAAKFSKNGARYARAEYLMRLSKKAEERGDISTARLCAMDAAKLEALDQPDFEGMVDPMQFMNPDEFVISSDPKILDAVNKTMEVVFDIDHEVVEPITENGKAEEKNG